MGLEIRIDLSGPLADHVRSETGEYGMYADPTEYIRDLIRRDRGRYDEERFLALKDELQQAFAVPDADAIPFDPVALRARMRRQHG